MSDIDNANADSVDMKNVDMDNVNIEESSADTEEVNPKKKKSKKVKRKSDGALGGSVAAKVTAFFLLAVSSLVAAVAMFCCAPALTAGLYRGTTLDDMVVDISQNLIEDAAYKMKGFISSETEVSKIKAYYASRNVDVEIWRNYGQYPIWGTYDGSYEPTMVTDIVLELDRVNKNLYLDGLYLSTNQKYIFKVYVNPEFPKNDNFKQVYEDAAFLYEIRYVCIWAALGGGIIAGLCFIFLMCSAGYKRDEDELWHGGIPRFEIDLIAAVLGTAGVVYLKNVLGDYMSNFLIFPTMLLKGGTTAIGVIWLTLCLYDMIRQMRYNKWWQHTLIWYFFQGCYAIICSVPIIFRTLLIYVGFCILEFVICLFIMQPGEFVFLLVEKLILLPIIVYLALCCKRFLFASRALTEGQLDYKLDTSKMTGAMKEHGQNLNSISLGISKAVEERIKSERLKTELITNVSHDLKTPLTSIINYSRLISEIDAGNDMVTEYSQVLLRQSERLKKLLEDLVEASKATTGNLEVNPVPCDVGVILSQAVGEYQQRLEEKELDLIISQPEAPLRIMADGRLLWRVFDNLLNNICKYAQESSRVYLNVEQQGERVLIIFRNMSKYALNMSADELEERFVRGDKSRHMEGNGLGLPIAKTLIELQNGQMEIVIDGDLFKVILSFDRLDE